MTTDLKSMTVEELCEKALYTRLAAYEIARRLEEAQQKIVAQEAAMQSAKDELYLNIKDCGFADSVPWNQVRAAKNKLSDDLSALAAHDAELTAKAKAEALGEVIAEIKAASEERLQFLEECRQEAKKWQAEGDDYGWNFHMGRSAGANWADLFYFRRIRKIEAKAAEYRAKAGRKE